MAQTGKATAAIQELIALEGKRDLILALNLLLIYANRKYMEAIEALDAKQSIALDGNNIMDRAYYMAGTFLVHIGEYAKAKEYLHLGKKAFPDSMHILNGYALLNLIENDNSHTYYDKIMTKSMRDIEAMLGKAIVYRRTNEYTKSLDMLGRLIAYHPSFIPAYIERLYVLIQSKSGWELVFEETQRLGSISFENIDYQIFNCLYDICTGGISDGSVSLVESIAKLIEKLETTNGTLYFLVARLFSKVANSNKDILFQCECLMERALSLLPNKSEIHNEAGQIAILQGNWEKARARFLKASEIEEQSKEAIEGLIAINAMTLNYEALNDQLEMFSTLLDNSSLVLYAKSVYKTSIKQTELAVNDLENAMLIISENLQAQSKNDPISSFLVAMNPPLLYKILHRYFKLIKMTNQPISNTACELIDNLVAFIPAGIEENYFKGYMLAQIGKSTEALAWLRKGSDNFSKSIKGYLLIASILEQEKEYGEALVMLDSALSTNFQVRQDVTYIQCRAKCLNALGQYDEAIRLLRQAFNYSAIKESISDLESRSSKMDYDQRVELAFLFSALIEALSARAENMDFAKEEIEKALNLFKGEPEFGKLLIVKAKFLVKLGKFNEALDVLGAIKPDEQNYLEAKVEMSDIFLNHKKDRKRYTDCLREIVERKPSIDSFIMLGEAYMKIQEPELAISVYSNGRKAYPKAGILSMKLGQAFVTMCDFSKAVSFYKNAINSEAEHKSVFEYELASLLYRMKKFSEAFNVLSEKVDLIMSNEICTFEELQILVLQAKISEGLPNYSGAVNYYTAAKDRLLKQILNSTNNDENQKKQLFEVVTKIADILSQKLHDYANSVSVTRNLIQIIPENEEAKVFFARLLMKEHKEEAKNVLSDLIESNPKNMEASYLLGDLNFENGNFHAAFSQYQELLNVDPTNFVVLASYIDVAFRIEKQDAPEIYFKQLESLKCPSTPGYHYCKGLLFKNQRMINEALAEFIYCRRDHVWGERAIQKMISIYLNPDNETLGGEAFSTDSNKQEITESGITGVNNATRLLDEMESGNISVLTKVLGHLLMIVSRKRDSIETAINSLLELLNEERDYIPAIYVTAVGYQLLKQSPRARNQLKRINKSEWTRETGEYLEMAWLLLADLYIQGGKFDLATELLKKVIAKNKSSTKAWEYLGYIMEKEQSYKDAGDNYLQCWRLERQRNPNIGYKLAFNYLKANRLTDAIDICHEVRKHHPNYPKIKAEILDKARKSLRCK